MYLSISPKNWLQYASNCLARPMSVANAAFCWPCQRILPGFYDDPPPPPNCPPGRILYRMCTLLHYFDDHAHSNEQERVYPHTLSCLKNGGRHSPNLVWGYTWTLPPFFRQEIVWGYTLSCLLNEDRHIV